MAEQTLSEIECQLSCGESIERITFYLTLRGKDCFEVD